MSKALATFLQMMLLSACATHAEWYEKKPDPPERCIVVSDGVNTICVAESRFYEWAKRNGI